MSQRLTVFLALALVLGCCANLALAEKREAPLTGTCLTDSDAAITNSSSFSTLRADYVEYNKLKSYYRSASILAIYTLTQPGRINLQGCADTCLLDWRTDGTTNGTLDTDCETASAEPFCTTSVNITANRKCEAFMYNVNSKKCYLIDGSGALNLRKANSYYSGFLQCADLSSIDAWAASITGR